MTRPTLHQIVEILRSRGDRQYGGEAVSQLEHALSNWTELITH
ncbi:hypothetical protein [Floridanema evergladense]|uniref:Uncharacterized protein n=1 Tax=Floridaenema evergladense BLCC-F167 TaxID=3153639 RepID=A0ABV4WIG8_9CYAN